MVATERTPGVMVCTLALDPEALGAAWPAGSDEPPQAAKVVARAASTVPVAIRRTTFPKDMISPADGRERGGGRSEVAVGIHETEIGEQGFTHRHLGEGLTQAGGVLEGVAA